MIWNEDCYVLTSVAEFKHEFAPHDPAAFAKHFPDATITAISQSLLEGIANADVCPRAAAKLIAHAWVCPVAPT